MKKKAKWKEPIINCDYLVVRGNRFVKAGMIAMKDYRAMVRLIRKGERK